jgi:hypothetical protein
VASIADIEAQTGAGTSFDPCPPHFELLCPGPQYYEVGSCSLRLDGWFRPSAQMSFRRFAFSTLVAPINPGFGKSWRCSALIRLDVRMLAFATAADRRGHGNFTDPVRHWGSCYVAAGFTALGQTLSYSGMRAPMCTMAARSWPSRCLRPDAAGSCWHVSVIGTTAAWCICSPRWVHKEGAFFPVPHADRVRSQPHWSTGAARVVLTFVCPEQVGCRTTLAAVGNN